jgi:hypothetical protein
MRTILTALAVLATLSTPSADADPIAIDASLFEHPIMVEAFADLVARSGYGRFTIELAAFVRLLPDGRFVSELWPSERGFQQASFTGRIPNGTVAIAHTHPLRIPRPSRHDVELAKRLGIAVLVLTPRNITVVQPDGSVETLLHDRSWLPSRVSR